MILNMATEYGSRLREARKDAKLTQEGLSKKTGIPQSTISTAERDGNGSAETPVYAQACGVNALWLAKGLGPKHPKKDDVQRHYQAMPTTTLPELSPAAYELGMVFDLIPIADRKKRAQAHVAATSAILAILEGHGIAAQALGQKIQSE